MTPPFEPMMLFAAVASLLYLLFWWVFWVVLADDGVELRYSEEDAP
ncbi:hypothetical protein [Natronorubrum halophilum]|nr:hypothetical protein [Natronorubrum halophilum]